MPSSLYVILLIGAVSSTLAPRAVAQGSSKVSMASFSIDSTEVTIGQFRRYTQTAHVTTTAQREGGGFEFAGGWVRRAGWSFLTPQGKVGADTEPAVHVTWQEAAAYCAAAGGKLPTSAQWKQAAFTEQRANPTDGFITGRTYVYAVGDEPTGMNNNRAAHVPVGTTKRGVNGLYDMGANVWEWLADRRGEDALTAGGSWWYGPEASKADAMHWKAASFYTVYIGFRCAYDSPR